MTQALAAAPSPAADPSQSDAAAWLRGRTVVHKIVLAMVEPAACLAAVFAELERVGGAVRSLHLDPTRHGTFEAVLRVGGIGAGEAAVMLDRLARLPSVRSAALEHVLIS